MYPDKVLGTANFNNLYGVTKKSIKKDQIESILNTAWNAGFRYLDTAADYKGVHELLHKSNQFSINDWKVITKLPKNLQNLDQESYKLVILDFFNSLKDNFKINRIQTILIHDHNFLKNISDNKMVLDLLLEEKNKGFFENLGLSVYDPIPSKQINLLHNFLNEFVIQCPLSIFDRRFEDNINDSSNNCKFQARSIFLQGLLLNEQVFKMKFPKSIAFDVFKKWLADNQMSSYEACISFVKHSKVSQIVVGFNSEKEIYEFDSVYENAKIINPPAFCNDIDILNPINW